MKTRLCLLATIVLLLSAMGGAAHAQAGTSDTLAFMEQALSARTWNVVDERGEEYGVYVVGCGCCGDIRGNVSVGSAVPTSATVQVDQALNNTCTLSFAPSAYDTIQAALVQRYGEPHSTSDAPAALAWTFQEAEIRLEHPSEAGLTLRYTQLQAPPPSQPTLPRPSAAAVPAPTPEPQAVKLSQENTFAFVEKASVADSWEALLSIMQQHGLYGYGSGCYADITGDLSIAGAAADVVMIVCGDFNEETVYETTGYDYDIWFDSEHYDAIKQALVERYGEPEEVEEPDHRFVWTFQQTAVYLLRSSNDRVVLCYYLLPTLDETKPALPSHPADGSPTAPAEEALSADEEHFVALMERVSLAYSRDALESIGLAYGFTVEENQHGARLGGVRMGGHTALRVDVCSPEGLPGFDCYAYFQPDAYDALEAALAKRYGKSVPLRDARGEGLVWPFAQADISLRRSVDGMAEVRYALPTFVNEFYLDYPPLLAEAPPSQAVTPTDAPTLTFLEQALHENSWEALEALGERYGVIAKREYDYAYNMVGNLSIGGFSATEGRAYHWGSDDDFDSNQVSLRLSFASHAYDAVLGALVQRYGEPTFVWDYEPGLIWRFKEEYVILHRSSFDGNATVSYAISEAPDEALPTFPPSQSVLPESATGM